MTTSMPARNLIEGVEGYGEGALILEHVFLSDERGVHCTTRHIGERLNVQIAAVAKRLVQSPNLGFLLNDVHGALLFGTSLKNLANLRGAVMEGERLTAHFVISCDIAPGDYWLTVVAGDNHGSVSDDSGVHHDTRERLGPLRILSGTQPMDFAGRIRLPHLFETVD
ncbi:Wzt carbohydrate-binding domain-containing protein [Bosea sp. 2RAB26]|uniref:Wzt carbohydrate-binding domain-containing protein n=1 Tax=Bosea sp. 2RAB26 TaxID=3237476 RepID=UPI003F92BA7B